MQGRDRQRDLGQPAHPPTIRSEPGPLHSPPPPSVYFCPHISAMVSRLSPRSHREPWNLPEMCCSLCLWVQDHAIHVGTPPPV